MGRGESKWCGYDDSVGADALSFFFLAKDGIPDGPEFRWFRGVSNWTVRVFFGSLTNVPGGSGFRGLTHCAL